MRARIWEAEGFSLVTFLFSSFLGDLENKRQLRRGDITHQLHLEWGSFFPLSYITRMGMARYGEWHGHGRHTWIFHTEARIPTHWLSVYTDGIQHIYTLLPFSSPLRPMKWVAVGSLRLRSYSRALTASCEHFQGTGSRTSK